MILLPIRTIPEKNKRERWWVTAKRVKEQRSLARMFTIQKITGVTRSPKKILLRRVSPRFLDVPDGLSCALAAIRDGVADAFGTDDSQRAGIEWTYDQRQGKPPCVEVELFFE